MKTKTIAAKPTAQTCHKVGDKWKYESYRIDYYIHESKEWIVMVRHCETLNQARETIAARKKANATLRAFVDFGRFPPTRIVLVKANCEIVE